MMATTAKRWVVGTVQSGLGTFLVMSMLPVVVPILLALWVWRCMVLGVVWVVYGRVARVATGMEAVFALDSAGARAVISGVAVLHGRVAVEEVRHQLSKKVLEARDDRGRLKHPKFRQVVERRMGVVVWMWEEGFSVEGHVHPLRVNDRLRLVEDEEDLVAVMGHKTNQQFVRGQAKWEVLVAPVRRFRRCLEHDTKEWAYTAVIVRVHHAMGDGKSIVGLIISALVDPPLSNPLPAIKNSAIDRFYRALRLMWSLTNLPWVMIRVLIRGDSSVLHGTRLAGEKFLAWSPPLSLATLKKARDIAGVSVNDLLLTGISAALHRLFRVEGGAVPGQVTTVIPVDVSHPAANLSLANRISLCTVPLPTGPMTLTERLKKVHANLNVLKSSPDIMANYFALEVLANLLPAPLARRALHTHGVTMVCSNMPGPQEVIHLFGRPVEDLMFFIPNKSRTGLGVSILSYRGKVRAAVNVDSSIIHNAEFAQELVINVIEEVENVLREISLPIDSKDYCHVDLKDQMDQYDSIAMLALQEGSLKYIDAPEDVFANDKSETQYLLDGNCRKELKIPADFMSDINIKHLDELYIERKRATLSDSDIILRSVVLGQGCPQL